VSKKGIKTFWIKSVLETPIETRALVFAFAVADLTVRVTTPSVFRRLL
jgi:hypothetical protein